MPLYNPSVLQDATRPSSATRPSTNVNTTASTFTATNGFTIKNTSTVTIYLAYGSTPTVTSSAYSVDLAAGAYYEDPYKFSGTCQLIAASGTTNAIQLTLFN